MAQTYEVCLSRNQTQGQLAIYHARPGVVPMSGQVVTFVPALHGFDGAGNETHVHRPEFRIEINLN